MGVSKMRVSAVTLLKWWRSFICSMLICEESPLPIVESACRRFGCNVFDLEAGNRPSRLHASHRLRQLPHLGRSSSHCWRVSVTRMSKKDTGCSTNPPLLSASCRRYSRVSISSDGAFCEPFQLGIHPLGQCSLVARRVPGGTLGRGLA
jgi:hypothetical protein